MKRPKVDKPPRNSIAKGGYAPASRGHLGEKSTPIPLTPERIERLRLRQAEEARRIEEKRNAAKQLSIEEDQRSRARHNYKTMSLHELWEVRQSRSGYSFIVAEVLSERLAASLSECALPRLLSISERIPNDLWEGPVRQAVEARIEKLLKLVDAETLQQLAGRADQRWATAAVKRNLSARISEFTQSATVEDVLAMLDRATGIWASETYSKATIEACNRDLVGFALDKLAALFDESKSNYPTELIGQEILRRAPDTVKSATIENLYDYCEVLDLIPTPTDIKASLKKRFSAYFDQSGLSTLQEWQGRCKISWLRDCIYQPLRRKLEAHFRKMGSDALREHSERTEDRLSRELAGQILNQRIDDHNLSLVRRLNQKSQAELNRLASSGSPDWPPELVKQVLKAKEQAAERTLKEKVDQKRQTSSTFDTYYGHSKTFPTVDHWSSNCGSEPWRE
jgi:hypothetical protein